LKLTIKYIRSKLALKVNENLNTLNVNIRDQKNPGFLKSPIQCFLGFYWVLGFIGFLDFLFE